jgi:hypothetical protein
MAVLYGIGASLDQQPELLFRLHEVDQGELIAKAGKGLPLAKGGPARSKVLGSEDLAGIFGLEMAHAIGNWPSHLPLRMRNRGLKKRVPGKRRQPRMVRLGEPEDPKIRDQFSLACSC